MQWLLALAVAVLLIPLTQPFVYAATQPTPTPKLGTPTTYDPTQHNTSITLLPKPPSALGWTAPTALLHYTSRDTVVDLPHTLARFNDPRPLGSPSAKAPAGVDTGKTFGAAQTRPVHQSTTHQTLSVALPEAGVVVAPHAGAAGPALALGTPATPSTTLTWNTFTQVATFGSPQAVSTDLTSAALIPPTTSVTTYYDKTNGGNAPTTPPVI